MSEDDNVHPLHTPEWEYFNLPNDLRLKDDKQEKVVISARCLPNLSRKIDEIAQDPSTVYKTRSDYILNAIYNQINRDSHDPNLAPGLAAQLQEFIELTRKISRVKTQQDINSMKEWLKYNDRD